MSSCFDAKGVEAEAHIELFRDDRVDLIARLELAVDHHARIGHVREVTRRGRDRIAVRLAVARWCFAG